VLVAYLAALGCAVAYGLGSVLQSIGARRVESGQGLDPRLLARVATQGPYLVGLGLDTLGWLLSLVALVRLPIFVVQAVVAGSIGFVVLFAALFQRQHPSARQLGFLAALVAGLAGLAISGAAERPHPVGAEFAFAMWVAVLLIALFGVIAPRLLTSSTTASVLAGLAGLAFGGTALCARSLASHLSIHSLLSPLLWAMAAFGALGLTFFAAALQRGSVTITTAWLFTTETVAPAVVGLIVLGDRARPGLGWLAAGSFVLSVVSAIGLSLVSPHEESVAQP